MKRVTPPSLCLPPSLSSPGGLYGWKWGVLSATSLAQTVPSALSEDQPERGEADNHRHSGSVPDRKAAHSSGIPHGEFCALCATVLCLPLLQWIAVCYRGGSVLLCCRVVLCLCVVLLLLLLLLQNLLCGLASDHSWKCVFSSLTNFVFGGLSWPLFCWWLCFDVLFPGEGHPCPHRVCLECVFLIFALSFPPCSVCLLFHPSSLV